MSLSNFVYGVGICPHVEAEDVNPRRRLSNCPVRSGVHFDLAPEDKNARDMKMAVDGRSY
jgi:hypothetical protein